MHAVIGQVKIKPGQEDVTRSMIGDGGIALLRAMPGSAGGYWARPIEGELIQHSFWMFDTEAHAREAEATFKTLREMSDAPATFVSVDVCEIIGQA